MYEKFLELKENKKWLFYLLIIPFVIVAGLEFYNRYLLNSGKQIVRDTEEEDKKLEREQVKAEESAKYHQEKAKELEKESNNVEVNKDWHLE